MEFLIYHPEFSKVDPVVIDGFIKISKQVVKEKPFGELYEQALYAYTAHKLAVKGYLNVDLKSGNPIFSNGEAFKSVASKTAGGLSISYGQQGSSGGRASDNGLDSTTYGQEYLSLRNLASPFGVFV